MNPVDEFFSGYLGQDVDILFGGPEEAVAEFARGSVEELAPVLSAVRDALALDDEGMVALTREWGSDVAAEGQELRSLLQLAVRTWAPLVEAEPLAR